jgi:hypothetical protein
MQVPRWLSILGLLVAVGGLSISSGGDPGLSLVGLPVHFQLTPEHGSGDYPGPPSGWTQYNQTIDWVNYTLPNFPGTRYFCITPCFNMDSVVIANDPAGQLTAYYVATNQSLVAYDLETNTSTVLVSTWLVNLTAADGPAMVRGFQDASGNVTVLFLMGATSTNKLAIQWYSLTNGSYDLVYTDIYNLYKYDVVDSGQGYGVLSATGWTYFMPNSTAIEVYNIFSNQSLILSTRGLPAWNSPTYVPTASQVMEDVNDPSNHTVQVEVWNLSLIGGTPTISYRMLWSASESFITSNDANNMPYFFDPNGSETVTWGLGVSSGANCHDLIVNLFQNLALDAVSGVVNTSQVCTSDSSVGAFWDTSGYYFNGYNGAYENAQYQAPFLDPLNESCIFASNSSWFNAFVTSHDFTRGAGPRVNTWSFFTRTGYLDGFLNGNVPTNYTGGILTVYWLPKYTDEFGPIPPIPPSISVSPASGRVGSTVEVSGNGFSDPTTLATLHFDNVTISSCASGSLYLGASGSVNCSFTVPLLTSGTTVTMSDIAGQSASATYLVEPPTFYSVTFLSQGLPPDADWSASLSGSLQHSTGTAILFVEPNGTYPFKISAIAGYATATATGNATVNGTNVTVAVQFTPIPPETYSVDFTESGLPSGSNWSVTLNGTTNRSNTSEITFEEPNGSYPFAVGTYGPRPYPSSGIVNVTGGPANRTITFTTICYGPFGCRGTGVMFTETGLPSGSEWSFTINETTFHPTSQSMLISLPNGTYPYTIGQIPEYHVSPAAGQVVLTDTAVTVDVTFTPNTTSPSHGSTPTFLGLPGVDLYVLAGAVAAVAVVGIVVGVVRHRRGKAPPDVASSIRPNQGP